MYDKNTIEEAAKVAFDCRLDFPMMHWGNNESMWSEYTSHKTQNLNQWDGIASELCGKRKDVYSLLNEVLASDYEVLNLPPSKLCSKVGEK